MKNTFFTQKLRLRTCFIVPKKLFNLTLAILLMTAYTYAQDCSGFRTQTQGGWGTDPHGGNPGVYLQDHFASAFPSGLTIGCTGSTLTLSTDQDVRDFLPSGSTPSTLPTGDMFNPGDGYNNVLAAQLVTATLSVGFDIADPDFGSNAMNLQDLTITSGPFEGWTVAQLLAEANNAIGGCSSTYDLSDINEALDNINNNYDDGNKDQGFLNCNHVCTLTVEASGDVEKCHGASTQLNAVASEEGVSYSWSPTTGLNNPNIANPVSSAGVTITYTVTVSSQSGCTASDQVKVTVFPLVKAHIYQVAPKPGCTLPCARLQTAYNSDWTYVWKRNGIVIVGATSNTYCACQSGTYRVVVSNSHGCNHTSAGYVVTISQRLEAQASAATDPVSFTAWPNPATSYLNITLNTSVEANSSLRLTDVFGRIVLSREINGDEGATVSFDTKDLTAGVYFAEILSGNSKSTEKVIITR